MELVEIKAGETYTYTYVSPPKIHTLVTSIRIVCSSNDYVYMEVYRNGRLITTDSGTGKIVHKCRIDVRPLKKLSIKIYNSNDKDIRVSIKVKRRETRYGL